MQKAKKSNIKQQEFSKHSKLRAQKAAAKISADVEAALIDRARVCPMLWGGAMLDGKTLRVRLPEGEFKITADKWLLHSIFELCDGNQSWSEILEKVKIARRADLNDFIEFLLLNGILIDSVNVIQNTLRYASCIPAIGINAEPSVVQKIRARDIYSNKSKNLKIVSCDKSASFFENLLERRISAEFFGEAALEESQLLRLLWSAGGIAKDHHEWKPGARRVIGSGGGLYLVEWILVLQRKTGIYEPGVYSIEFPTERAVALCLQSTEIEYFIRAFKYPWQAKTAAGAIFAIANTEIASLKYRNRAVQLLFLEAGAGFQNIVLSAAEQQLGVLQVGGYSDEYVSKMLGLNGQLILGCALFGSHAIETQRTINKKTLPVDFQWGESFDEIYPLPYVVATTKCIAPNGEELTGWGTDRDPWVAYLKSHAEIVERSGRWQPKNCVYGKIKDVKSAIEPTSLVRYSDQQYKNKNFPYSKFKSNENYHWVRCTDMLNGEIRHVIGCAVYPWEVLNTIAPHTRYTQATSSGCAAGQKLESALLASTLELIERDSFMRCWLQQKPGYQVKRNLLPGEFGSRLDNLEEAGCTVCVQLLPSVAGYAILASAQHNIKKFTLVTAAARMSCEAAVAAALDELELIVYSRLQKREVEQYIEPREVVFPREHSDLYGNPKFYRNADLVINPTRSLDAWPKARPADLSALLDDLKKVNLNPVFADITPSLNRIDQGRISLTVTRVVIPSLIPISFGYGLEPRGMIPEAHEASIFPHPFP